MLWTRRNVLVRGAAALALLGSGSRLLGARSAEAATNRAAKVFPQSIASGDPSPTGAIVWTRIAREARRAKRDLLLEVARDTEFREVVVEERIAASRIDAENDFIVRVDLDGRLTPNRRFYYRFVYDGTPSRTGRLRTLPEPDESPERLRLALVSCQDYTRGFFNGYADIAREEIDYILHVGDFLYETVVPERSLPGRRFKLPSGALLASTLDDFRAIHRTYRTDPSIQRAFERHTLLTVWDDHDVANDRYWDPVAARPRAPDHPGDDDPQKSDAVHAAGIRAWWENLPVRVRYDPASASLRDRIRIERSFRFGKLADLFLTDGRLRRDPHPCGEEGPGVRFYRMAAKCPDRLAEGRTMLGEEQRAWLVDGLAESPALWKLWATSVPLTPVGYGSGPGRLFLTYDTWMGYEHERRRILGDLAGRGVKNLVSLTGDLHAFFAAKLHAGDSDPLAESLPAVGVELATGALTAPRAGEFLSLLAHAGVIRDNNPHIAAWNSSVNGYSLVEITADSVEWEPRAFAIDRRLDPAAAPTSSGRLRVRSGVADFEEV